MKALIGIDGSDHGFSAVSLAGRLLVPERDQAVLYHSCSSVKLDPNVDASLQQRACQAVANVVFEEAKSRLPAALASNAQTVLADDRAGVDLGAEAERQGAELIAIGARGLSRLEGLLLGSVSNSVVRSSQTPVLVARNVAPKPTDEFRVLVAYDRINAVQHADFLGKLNWPPGTTAQVVAVIESMLPSHLPAWIQKRARDADTEAMSQAWLLEHEQDRQEKERELADFAQRLPAPFQSGAPIVVEGNPAEQLIAVVERERPSIIVVGKAMKNLFDRWFLGSVSEKVLAHANCSVLVIPASNS